MNFRKTAIALTAAGALAAGTIGATQQAAATPAWVIPAIIVAGVGGIALGASSNAFAYGPPAHVGYAAPASNCWVENRRGGPVEVCRR
jgi:hypothetical protein